MATRFNTISDTDRGLLEAVTILDLSRWLKGRGHKWDWWREGDAVVVELFRTVGEDWISAALVKAGTLDEAVKRAIGVIKEDWLTELAGRGGKGDG